MSSYSDSTYFSVLDKSSVIQHPYYISDIEPCDYSFDKSKVGVNAKANISFSIMRSVMKLITTQ